MNEFRRRSHFFPRKPREKIYIFMNQSFVIPPGVSPSLNAVEKIILVKKEMNETIELVFLNFIQKDGSGNLIIEPGWELGERSGDWRRYFWGFLLGLRLGYS